MTLRRALLAVALLCAAQRAAAAQAAAVPAIPVVAIGEGRSFATALSSAMRMAVESGAGATVAGAVSSQGDRIGTDSVRSVSRGVVTHYVVLDSAHVAGGERVRILAMVARINERDAVGARAQRVAAPGALWTANAALDSARRIDEGRLLSEIFSSIDRQPSVFAYEVETGPPVPSGANLRMRLRIIRSPAPAYDALRDRAHSILAAIAGPAGARATHLPLATAEKLEVRPCVSHCASGERRVLNARAALDNADSAFALDPPILTGTSGAPMQTLFPDLRTVGGFALAFPDSAKQRQHLVHVRSTRGYIAVVDYMRATFDDARLRVEIGGRTIDMKQSFRAPVTGEFQPHFSTSAPPGSLPVALVRGFRARLEGGPGASTALGSPYVILTVPPAARVQPDTALVDVWLTSGELSRVTTVAVEPLATTHRLEGSNAASPLIEPVPLAVLDALARHPLSDGDGAIVLPPPNASVVAVGSATISPVTPTQACAVARLRAQRELVRYITGSHVEGRVGLSASESRGGQVQELFREEITETVAGRIAGAALASQWTVNDPPRCRVALWLADGFTVRKDSADHPSP